MDSMSDSGESYYVALYAVVSFVLVMLIVLLLYVACTKKYRLNWFEQNLLETADAKELAHSQEALMCQDSVPGSSRTLCTSPGGNDKFWVPHNLHRQSSVCVSEVETSPEDSLPASPVSPTGYQSTSPSISCPTAQQIATASLCSGPVPITRNDIILSAAGPVRPKVASMQSKLDHTKIDTSLYQKEQPSEPEDIRGSVHITLTYDPVAGILTVRLIEAHDLQARDFSGTADPYAKIRLLPDRTNIWQTRIHKRTLNPVFDEDFVFEVRPATIGRRTLEIILYDFDAYSRHHSIGGVQLPLAHVDLSERVSLWRSLGPCSDRDAKAELGDLMVSLAYLPSAERLTVVVIKARNLRVVDDTRTSSDPYVKVSLIHGVKRLKKRKTGVHRNTVCPVFNEALTFDVNRETLKNCSIEFCVMHDSLLGASELLGRNLVGRTSDSRQEERDFFNEILHSKTATAQWLSLSDPRTPR
ncbi:Synaptotagmin alpha [Carabus blaptoides fortunei]